VGRSRSLPAGPGTSSSHSVPLKSSCGKKRSLWPPILPSASLERGRKGRNGPSFAAAPRTSVWSDHAMNTRPAASIVTAGSASSSASSTGATTTSPPGNGSPSASNRRAFSPASSVAHTTTNVPSAAIATSGGPSSPLRLSGTEIWPPSFSPLAASRWAALSWPGARRPRDHERAVGCRGHRGLLLMVVRGAHELRDRLPLVVGAVAPRPDRIIQLPHDGVAAAGLGRDVRVAVEAGAGRDRERRLGRADRGERRGGGADGEQCAEEGEPGPHGHPLRNRRTNASGITVSPAR
jgi:hypothetical protein